MTTYGASSTCSKDSLIESLIAGAKHSASISLDEILATASRFSSYANGSSYCSFDRTSSDCKRMFSNSASIS